MVKKKLEHLALITKSISIDKLEAFADQLIERDVNKLSLLTDVDDNLKDRLEKISKDKELKINLQQINQGREILLNRFKGFLQANYQDLQKLKLSECDSSLREFMAQGDGFMEPDLIVVAKNIDEQKHKSLANNLIWESNYAEIYFSSQDSETFDEQELAKAIDDYHVRQRNFGE